MGEIGIIFQISSCNFFGLSSYFMKKCKELLARGKNAKMEIANKDRDSFLVVYQEILKTTFGHLKPPERCTYMY